MHSGVAALVLILLIGILCAIGLLSEPFRQVSRARVEKFARRQSLPVNTDNGPLIIRYLATTRRWRGSGLLASLAMTILGPWVIGELDPGGHVRQSVGVNGLALFVGWFVGAVIAEWRVSAATASGPRRTATLQPRRLADYVRRPSRVAPAVSCALVAAFEVFVLAFVLARHRGGLLPVLGWIGLTAIIGVLLALVGRQVLLRPQPYVDPDMVSADDAIRSRSLHVLAGSALAISGYLGAVSAEILAAYSTVLSDGIVAVIGVIGILFLPILGFIVATSTMLPIRRGARTLTERAA